MLVLGRKKNESVIVIASNGEVIEVVFLGVKRGTRGSLGFKAPESVKVIRKELLEPEETP